jgi:hypothetical protein
MSEENWPKQDDNGIRQTNIQVLLQAIDLLYQTHITNPDSAIQRGHAIQAISKMLVHLGHTNAIQDVESVPYSQRMRESEVWKDEEPKS